MKTYLFLLIALLLTACGGSQQAGQKPVITVSIEPLRYFAEAIAGDRYQVVSMVPEGSSPETYDPTPRQMIDLSRSRAFLRAGYLGYELAWADKLQQNAKDVPFFDLSEGIELIREEGHAHAGGIEPHIWTSITNAGIIADNIARVMCRLDPEHAEEYKTNAAGLKAKITNLDKEIRAYLPDAPKAFLIYHPALSYFAREYGLTQISIEEGGKEPSPAQLETLITRCREMHVGVIFVQKEFDTRNAEVIARELHVPTVTINPLSYQWEREMRAVARVLSNPNEKL
ncbi:periplasmic solute binding protein [Phocaeicola salanitronis DSM 18170]|uniref:Periplasmic solute binding protein n=1 Tax=Phocaeicola salanitronis (strain DSM 18170 / JCM 13657 / CCUG 60908 / BL78) TaxID=667015 RepID=F0R817_PHOSB|nr:zinc ABC transporter substrate-binding protein [Phocaeicola salanitronis]ADY36980.1 periplasmic solute binding protein [Phocaeicola salanitronis DSM 18170]